MSPRRWAIPLALSILVLLCQIWPASPVFDVASLKPPLGVTLTYPWTHVAFAPLTLLADWLNAGSRQDLKDFLVWCVLVYALARLLASVRRDTNPAREAGLAALFAGCVLLFFVWGAFAGRPIPRLVAGGGDTLVYDVHSHTAASHDGRRGFGAEQNARWHAAAGFGAAFVTDHNVWGAARMWRRSAPAGLPPLLDGEELSLSGLHVLVLGNDTVIANAPWNSSWDSTLTLIRRLPTRDSVLLVACIAEDWGNHWRDVGDLVDAGVRGFEVWNSSPGAMEFPQPMRALLVARARLSNLPLFGSTDMHGFGHTASVWNVTTLPGWRAMDTATLQRALLDHLRHGGFAVNTVIAMRRWLPVSRWSQAIAVPAGLVLAVRSATTAHRLSLLAWTWVMAAVTARIRTPRA